MDNLIIFTAEYLIVFALLLAGYFFWMLDAPSKRRLINLSVLTFPLVLLLTKTLALFIYTTRPFVSEHVQPLISHTADNGFPSDHTVLTMAVAAVIFLFNRKAGVLLGVLSLSIGSARLLANIHQPVDIVGGVLIALLSCTISWYALQTFGKLDAFITSLVSKVWVPKESV